MGTAAVSLPAPVEPILGDVEGRLRERIRFVFVGYGERAPAQAGQRDRLFLDVGNDLRPGVIDHHHQTSLSGSTATLVLRLPELVDLNNPRRDRATDRLPDEARGQPTAHQQCAKEGETPVPGLHTRRADAFVPNLPGALIGR